MGVVPQQPSVVKELKHHIKWYTITPSGGGGRVLHEKTKLTYKKGGGPRPPPPNNTYPKITGWGSIKKAKFKNKKGGRHPPPPHWVYFKNTKGGSVIQRNRGPVGIVRNWLKVNLGRMDGSFLPNTQVKFLGELTGSYWSKIDKSVSTLLRKGWGELNDSFPPSTHETSSSEKAATTYCSNLVLTWLLNCGDNHSQWGHPYSNPEPQNDNISARHQDK